MVTSPRPHLVILGGGITGLAAAHRLATAAPDGAVQITLLEAGDRLGGWVRTETFAGRPVDFGPDSLLVRMPWAAELAREVGLAEHLVAPGEGGAFLLSRGRLRALPAGILAGLPGGPMPFVRSGLLGPLGLLRAAGDLVLPANTPEGDESIGNLVRRRLGRQVLERVIDPLLGGVHAGRCDDLSLQATAPQIAAAARADRSLLRGLRATAPPPPEPGTAPRPVFQSPRAGMRALVDATVAAFGDAVDVRLGARAVQLTDLGDAVRVVLDGGEELLADGVIVSLPAQPTAELIGAAAPQMASSLRALQYASVAHVAMAFASDQLPELPAGTGFLVPRPERRLMTACTFLDRKWPQRRTVGAEHGHGDDPLASATVIKCSVGRIDDARFRDLTDVEIVDLLREELRDILGITAPVLDSRIVRVDGGLPQYSPGHLQRIATATAEIDEALPAVRLVGAAYRGASLPLCIRDGRQGADAQLARLGLSSPSTPAVPA